LITCWLAATDAAGTATVRGTKRFVSSETLTCLGCEGLMELSATTYLACTFACGPRGIPGLRAADFR
jgi:hypothetical protein